MEDDDVFDVDQSLRDSITGLVSALGGIDHADPAHAYLLGDDALGCLKDIKKWIRFYAAAGKLDALRCIADTNLVQLDLCSILAAFTQGQEHDNAKARLALNCRNSPTTTGQLVRTR
jgi:replication fork protection complex subunit Tof1/Swi1